MKVFRDYDENCPLSIEAYAQGLKGHTFHDVINWAFESYETGREDASNAIELFGNTYRKGGLGNLLEQLYFGYDINSDSSADFKFAGVELKVTPYEIKKDGGKRAGLVLTMISYNEPVEPEFYKSHLWDKCRLLLLVYYLRDKSLGDNLMYQIDYVKLFTPPLADLKIIEDDYKYIIDKIAAGKAHEISEGDTMYLGACTKGATAEKSTVPQLFYNPDVKARKRAFCFKNSYMTTVLNDYIVEDITTFHPVCKDADVEKRFLKDVIPLESIVKDDSVLENKTFAEYITEKINAYVGKTDVELCEIFQREYNNNKAQWYDLVFKMLGIKSTKAAEFQKANIVVKAIRLKPDGKMVESSPLPPFSFKQLVSEEWEDSSLYEYLSETKFLFVVYQQEDAHYVLKGCQLWNMPYNDLNVEVQEGWTKIKDTIANGLVLTKKEQKNGLVIENNLPKKKDNRIIHIRPHSQKSFYVLEDGEICGSGTYSDADQLPDGRWMTKQSFWLNNDYVMSVLDESLTK